MKKGISIIELIDTELDKRGLEVESIKYNSIYNKAISYANDGMKLNESVRRAVIDYISESF